MRIDRSLNISTPRPIDPKLVDLPKEGSHYDLPIALGLMAAVGAIARDAIEGFCVLGELALDGSIATVAGTLPAAIGANALGKGLICPASCGPEAAWAAADMTILAPSDLLVLVNHFKGAKLAAARAERRSRRRGDARSEGHQGPGDRQACARGRRCRRPQPAHVITSMTTAMNGAESC